MSEKTKEVPQLTDATYAHTLIIKSTHEYRVHGPYGSNYGTWKVGTIWTMDLVFMSTFDNKSMSIGCVGKLGHISGFLRHYLLTHVTNIVLDSPPNSVSYQFEIPKFTLEVFRQTVPIRYLHHLKRGESNT